MSPRVTLRTIADLAKCSTATVSTVLNSARGNTKVSDAVREDILAIAHRLNYCPNVASRNLRLGHSKTLGIYVQPSAWHGLGYNYEMTMFRGFEEAALEYGYDLLVLNIGSKNLPEICAQRLHEGRIDGVILIHCNSGEWINELLTINSNIVAMDFYDDYPALNTVSLDNRAAIQLAFDRLHRLGHTRIGWVGCVLDSSEPNGLNRLKAFKSIAGEMHCDQDERLIFDVHNCPVHLAEKDNYCQQGGKLAMHYFSQMAQPPTAVICENYLYGTHMIFEANKMGISIPGQMSIIGIDRSDLNELAEPELTVIDHRLPEMGKTAATELIKRLNYPNSTDTPFKILFQPGFWEGNSTGPAPTSFHHT